ncbi:MAG: dihydrodipicolinate synthetase [Chloroflexi bacterium]|nr:dihydrodipicolinate synthetase [Chloroflexota bacterium]
MYTTEDLHGVNVMMPAFATENAGDILSTSTIHVDHLRAGVNRIIQDGIHVMCTTATSGECHTLLLNEFETLARAAIEAVNQRVPLFLGCTSVHTRETIQKMRIVRDAGGEGVLVGVPYYFSLSVDNVIRFYNGIAEAFPDLSIMIYHNPLNHRVHIPVSAFRKITQSPNIIGMKDSHRTTQEFMKLMDVVRGKMRVFVAQSQIYPYGQLGAAGCWSIDAWMGPWPLLRLWRAVQEGDVETARELAAQIPGGSGGPPVEGGGMKLAMKYAGYCDPGPNRPPFLVDPPGVEEAARRKATQWQELCARYRPQMEPVGAV